MCLSIKSILPSNSISISGSLVSEMADVDVIKAVSFSDESSSAENVDLPSADGIKGGLLGPSRKD